MRTRSTTTSILYAGSKLLQPGDYFEGENYGASREYTTSKRDIIGASAPMIETYGNASGTFNFQVLTDFRSEEEAFAAALERVALTDSVQTGTLTLAIGEQVLSWQAGIQSVSWDMFYVGAGDKSRVRLAFSYSFILGEKL